MLLQIVSPLILSLSLFQNGATNKDAPPKPYEDAEAYEVYSAILPTSWAWQVAKAQSLVIGEETIAYKMRLRPDAESEAVVGPAISEYVRLNEKTWLLQRSLSIEKPYELVGSDEFKKSVFKGDWESFYKRRPNSGGWIGLSPVGFNADKTVAVVFMTHACGSLCGGGDFYVLQKKGGKWIPLKWVGTSCGFAV
jgi:hypothetical protein